MSWGVLCFRNHTHAWFSRNVWILSSRLITSLISVCSVSSSASLLCCVVCCCWFGLPLLSPTGAWVPWAIALLGNWSGCSGLQQGTEEVVDLCRFHPVCCAFDGRESSVDKEPYSAPRAFCHGHESYKDSRVYPKRRKYGKAVVRFSSRAVLELAFHILLCSMAFWNAGLATLRVVAADTAFRLEFGLHSEWWPVVCDVLFLGRFQISASDVFSTRYMVRGLF